MFFKFFNFAVLSALVLPLCTIAVPIATPQDEPVHQVHNLTRRFDNTKWTFYNVETGNQVSCGGFHTNNEAIVALSSINMNPGLCGKTIRMTFQGVTRTATILDTCPSCPPNGLDLSQGLFPSFASPDVGIIFGSWDFVDGGSSPPPPPPAPPAPPPPPAPPAPPPPPAPPAPPAPPPPPPPAPPAPPAPSPSNPPPPPPPQAPPAPAPSPSNPPPPPPPQAAPPPPSSPAPASPIPSSPSPPPTDDDDNLPYCDDDDPNPYTPAGPSSVASPSNSPVPPADPTKVVSPSPSEPPVPPPETPASSPPVSLSSDCPSPTVLPVAESSVSPSTSVTTSTSSDSPSSSASDSSPTPVPLGSIRTSGASPVLAGNKALTALVGTILLAFYYF